MSNQNARRGSKVNTGNVSNKTRTRQSISPPAPVLLFLVTLLFFLAHKEWYTAHNGNIPTVQNILDLWDQDIEAQTTEDQQLLLWYFDRWMPAVAGKLYWTQKVRYYKKLTDTMFIGAGGDESVCVSSASEAFGLLILENCSEKWLHTFNLRKGNPSAKLPTEGAEAEKYHAKYTDNKRGGIKFGGWNPEGLERFQTIVEAVRQLRQADNKKDEIERVQSHALQLMRDAHDIKQETSKKKRRTAATTNHESPKKKIKRFAD